MRRGAPCHALVLGSALVIAQVAGCTTLRPVAGEAMPPGMMVSLGINDVGRVGLASQMGQSVGAIEGRLVEHDSAAYVLAVAQVETLRGDTQVWSGEHVRINSEFVGTVREKRFSLRKTAVVGAAAVGLVAILASQSLFGSGSESAITIPPDTAMTIRIPIFFKR